MIKPLTRVIFVLGLFTGTLLKPNCAMAQYSPLRIDMEGAALRAGAWEFYLVGQYWHADRSTIHNVTLQTAPPPNGSYETGDLTMTFDDAGLWGFGLGYDLNSHFAIRGEFTGGKPRYQMTFNDLTGRGEAWIQAGKFNLDYNVIRGPVTPFVSAGLGYLYIDSGIPTGPTETWYWWDYWWGSGYDTYTPTQTETWFTANAAAGIRWDVTDRFFFKASFGANWVRADANWLTTVEAMLTAGVKF